METGMSRCKPIDTPMDPNTKLKPRMDEMTIDKGQYQCLIGKLIYLTHTCPIISFAVNIVSKFLSNPLEAHLEAVYRVLRYLKEDPRIRPLFTKSLNCSLEVYTNTFWVGSLVDRRSISRYCTYVLET